MQLSDLFPINEAIGPDGDSFWGEWGAGVLPFAQSTKRFLIGHRSQDVLQPGDWGPFGGKADDGETNPEIVAVREWEEETGYDGPHKLIPIYVYRSGSFKYYNFIAVVPDEYRPRLDWENQGAKWVEYGKWPTPMHFGLKAILDDPKSVQVMRGLVGEANAPKNSKKP